MAAMREAAGWPTLEFWFEFGSTYSYLSVMRIEALAERARVGVVWRPFLLGPVFGAQGLNTSPFVAQEAKDVICGPTWRARRASTACRSASHRSFRATRCGRCGWPCWAPTSRG